MVLFGIDVRIYFLLFITYAIAGWIMEVIGKLIECKRFINRGFLIGPYCPIYGYGALAITFLLGKYADDPVALFIMAILIFAILEYLTSYFMEKKFKARWWDYSQRKFNINGRVCLNTIIPFGLMGLFVIYVSNPFLLSKYELIPEFWLNIISGVLFVIFIADNIVSGIIIGLIKKTEQDLGDELDNTEEITKKVREVLQAKSFLHRRLLDAYPNFEAVKVKIKEKKQAIENRVEKERREIGKKVENTTRQIEKKVEETTKTIGNKVKNIKAKDNNGNREK